MKGKSWSPGGTSSLLPVAIGPDPTGDGDGSRSEVPSSYSVMIGMDNFFYSCLFRRSSFLATSMKTMMTLDSLLVEITKVCLAVGGLVVGTSDGGDGDQVLLQVHFKRA